MSAPARRWARCCAATGCRSRPAWSAAAGAARAVRLLGEDLVLFRTTAAVRSGLLDERCPHRGASLRHGCVDADGIRCPYHGWKFAPGGACLEMPASRPSRRAVAARPRRAAYRVAELGGLVFAYLGPEPAPLLPRYDLFVWHGRAARRRARAVIPCNWLQIMENSVDPVHLEWLHGHHLASVRTRLGLPRAHALPEAARGDRLRSVPLRHRQAPRPRGRQPRGRRLARRPPAGVPDHGARGRGPRSTASRSACPSTTRTRCTSGTRCYLPPPRRAPPSSQDDDPRLRRAVPRRARRVHPRLRRRRRHHGLGEPGRRSPTARASASSRRTAASCCYRRLLFEQLDVRGRRRRPARASCATPRRTQ